MSRRRNAAGPEVVLPITPMLDMTFQLLFFFMGTFNPTDPEVALVLAMSKEEKVEPSKQSITPSQTPNEKEEPKIDTDLRLFISQRGGGQQPILLKDGAIEVKRADTLKDADLLSVLKAKVEERRDRARLEARKSGWAEGSAKFDEAVAADFALQKVRIQTTVDVPWGDVYEAMNLCTHVGFKRVALATPTDYVSKK